MNQSQEYYDVFAYMKNVLTNEFPSSEYTPAHFILSMLDNPKCHANIIMDNLLMSESMDYLRQHYHQVLNDAKKKPILNNDGPKISRLLDEIISNALDEAKYARSKQMGTEHVLMSLLNPNNNYSDAKALIDSGLHYDYVAGKSDDFKDSTDKEKKRYINNNGGDSKIPLKSGVNSKLFVKN
jgi:ATP-dependent Clp protease ATP-binding subunit ClpA